jgi:hypothetical protein
MLAFQLNFILYSLLCSILLFIASAAGSHKHQIIQLINPEQLPELFHLPYTYAAREFEVVFVQVMYSGQEGQLNPESIIIELSLLQFFC